MATKRTHLNGGFFETEFVTTVARITPTETTVNASGEYTFGDITIEGQVGSHSFNNGRSGDDTIAFDRTGSSLAVTFDAGNATHTLTVEEHAEFDVNVGDLSRNPLGGSQFFPMMVTL